MRKVSVFIVLILVSALATALLGKEKEVRARLESIGGSGVSGFVQLTQLPHGGSNLRVHATGLDEGTEYSSFYYESDDCSAPADLLESFTADNENAMVFGKIDEDLDEVGSVSIRLGPGYGTLLACAVIHE
jgi:hypothetical protein